MPKTKTSVADEGFIGKGEQELKVHRLQFAK